MSFSGPIKAGDNPSFCSATTAGCTSVGLLPEQTRPTRAGGFGTVTSTVPNINPRQFQFALKLLFYPLPSRCELQRYILAVHNITDPFHTRNPTR